MLLPYRKLLPLLLAILLGWQSVAVAQHLGEHHHAGKVDYQCTLCALALPVIQATQPSLDVDVPAISTKVEYALTFHAIPAIAPQARAPPAVLQLNIKD